MSGYRPFRKFRSAAEMKKAIIRGVRPSLRQDSINSNLPFLECIMEVKLLNFHNYDFFVLKYIYRVFQKEVLLLDCLLYTSPSPRVATLSRMPSSA